MMREFLLLLAFVHHSYQELVTLYSRCTVTTASTVISGICVGTGFCRGMTRGVGTCGPSQVCCAYSVPCGKTSSLNVLYLVSPATIPTMCSYQINPSNKKICQMRLDFEVFEISPPRQSLNASVTEPFGCLDDELVVKSISHTTLKIPKLCGYNSGQHMYVPVRSSGIKLAFTLSDREYPSVLPPRPPTWRIRVTQLECGSDYHDIAPAGCLQYFKGRSGWFMNFGYNPNHPMETLFYTGDQHYAICFNSDDACRIKLYARNFKMALGTSETSCVPKAVGAHTDYMYIPQARVKYSNNVDVQVRREDYFCGSDFAQDTVIYSDAAGPFWIDFRTNNVPDSGHTNSRNQQHGFLFFYERLSRCK